MELRHLVLSLLFVVKMARAQNTKIGAYYYPWHADDFHRDQGYLREFLNQRPQLGEYDDRDPAVIRQHMEWSAYANIGVWVTSWFGPGSREDTTMLSTILPTMRGTNLEFCIFYETANRVGSTDPKLHRVVDDVNHLVDNYLSHPNYYRIDNKPVLFVYITRVLDRVDVLAEVLLLIRSAAAKRGVHFYLVGDHAFGPPPTEELLAFDYLDAITNYDTYGGLGRFFVGAERLNAYYEEQRGWARRAAMQNCAFIPAVTPGFNDRGVRLQVDHKPLSRKLTMDSEYGSLFEASIEIAMGMVDKKADRLLMVTSFNEWHEDTQIEPCVGATTNIPYNMTNFLYYEGYGMRYLDILRAMTASIGPAIPSTAPQPQPTIPAPVPKPTSTTPPAPTPKPTSIPKNQQPEICDDSKIGTFNADSYGDQQCVWLAARPAQQDIYCRPGQPAYDLCEETCAKCSDDCEDDPGTRFEYEGVRRPCSWLTLRPKVQMEVCVEGNDALQICGETCDSCDGYTR